MVIKCRLCLSEEKQRQHFSSCFDTLRFTVKDSNTEKSYPCRSIVALPGDRRRDSDKSESETHSFMKSGSPLRMIRHA
ncbi:hypothetical protein NQZ68_017132, partial [Dissostichus eleginoides]